MTAPVVRLRPAIAPDSYGDPSESWTGATRVALPGASIQPVRSSESNGLLKDERRLFVPAVVDLTAADRVEAEGAVWRVDGDPIVRRGLASGVLTTASLRRLERVAA